MSNVVKNILFIMCDQLRFDYLSCAGHPHLHTPNVDWLAEHGVRFTNAYCQSPVCGPSRMSFYTGRYMQSHGATWNKFPLNVSEWTLGDYMRQLNVKTGLVGKTHMQADTEGMARLGIDPESVIGVRVAECGFDPYDRHDGLHCEGPNGRYDPVPPQYEKYLHDHGYDSDNPWEDWANSAENDKGEILSGWFMKYAARPARVKEEHSETAYTTDRAMDYIRECGEEPWCLHLSYIKPHWPYIVPAPYHDMYGPEHVIPAQRNEKERENANPLYASFMKHRVGQAFSRQGAREGVIPAYMGLVKQIDDHIGRLLAFLKESGRLDDTLIVFTSDHGDYLGDHWLGEKDLFHDPSVKIPLIVYDPSESANTTRGQVRDELVESIDLIPTFIDILGGEAQPQRLEGRSLLPFLRDEPINGWRTVAISEYDYAILPSGAALEKEPDECFIIMATTERWKYVEPRGFEPILFDKQADPEELNDLGRDPDYQSVIDEMRSAVDRWARRQSQRTTVSREGVLRRRGASAQKGILIGFWDESELPQEVTAFMKSKGRIPSNG